MWFLVCLLGDPMSKAMISLIIPAYNEFECIESSIQRVHKVMEQTNNPFEILMIDDGSQDKTWEKIVSLSNMLKEVKGLRLSRNFGKEQAICAGLDQAIGDAVILLDADMQHPPELLPDMIHRWEEGSADIIEAVKVSRGDESLSSKLFAHIFYTLMGKLSGFDFSGASDYKLLDRKVVLAWKEMGERNVFFRAMSAWVGFEREHITFEVADREHGESKWSTWALLGLAIKGITAFSTAPLRMISISGLFFLVFAGLVASNTMYQYFMGEAVTGFSTVILLLLIISSLMMLALGIIGEYIAKIYEEVKGRPRYIVSKTTSNKADS